NAEHTPEWLPSRLPLARYAATTPRVACDHGIRIASGLRINRGKAVETFSAKHHVMRLGSVWTHTNFVTAGIDPSARLFVPPKPSHPQSRWYCFGDSAIRRISHRTGCDRR